MKLREDFVLRQIAQTWVILPLGEKTVDFSGMLTLNETGAMLWRVLERTSDPKALVEALISEYDVSEEQAQSDVNAFLDKLIQVGCVIM